MTAQVAVMNKLGIALATDSAVTVSSGQDDAAKIYSSSEKLFRLSDDAPVAIMMSDRSRFLKIPWETVIEVYRKQLGGKIFSKLSDYTADFFRFVQTNTKMFPQSAQDAWAEWFFAVSLYHVLNESERRHKESDESAKHAEKNMPAIIHEVAIELMKEEKEYKKITGFNASMDRTVRVKYGRLVAKNKKVVFKDHRLPVKTQRVLNDLIFESISRTGFKWMTTGIVFAGFGENEYMPVCLAYEVEGMICNKLRHRLIDNTHMTKYTAAILPFAQTDVVRAFLDGISPQLESDLGDAIVALQSGMKESFENVFTHQCTARQRKQLDAMVQKHQKSLSESWQKAEHNFRKPFFDVVQSFPKDELAAMAEMLVNLTKFRLRVSPELETVGGPIDVAIITKGDGFVWVKKKQYYPAELNPHKAQRPV